MGELSSVFDCEIRHWYSEPKNGINGYDCYDGGEHMDSKMEAEWPESDHAEENEQTHLYLVSDSQPGERATASAESSGTTAKIV